MFRDETVHLIYASHVIEYFDREEVIEVLKEWRRVLLPEGILRLSVPDFSVLVDIYSENRNLNQVIGPIFGRWKPDNTDLLLHHKMVYDCATLDQVLVEAGFCESVEWDWRTVFIEDLSEYDDYSKAYIPHLNFESGRKISLNREAIKAG